MEQLLTVRNLRVWFDVRIGFIAGLMGRQQKHVRAIDDVTFDVRRGEVFCLVGESGCGKTTTGKALLRLNEPTSGNIYFDVPDETWGRITALENRLAALAGPGSRGAPADGVESHAAWKQIRKLTKELDQLRRPPSVAARVARLDRCEKQNAFLESREKELTEGTDPAIKRILSKERHRLELMEAWGGWFTPKRERKFGKLQKDIKEAKYQVVRATSQHQRTGKFVRKVRRLEARIEAMQSHKKPADSKTLSRVRELRQAIEEKQKRLTTQELQRVREERKALAPQIAILAQPEPGPLPAETQRIESQLAALRKEGGPALEGLELRAQLDGLGIQYDLARWGVKRKSQGPRGRRRKEYDGGMREPRRGRRKRYNRRMRELRRRMQIIYQDPYESLNPKLSIYDIVAEPLLANRVTTTQAEAQAAVAKSLEDVGLRPAQEYMFRYPHELSGGQRQRVGIATALVVDPDFIVADEPVSMLDASVRTEIIALLLDLRKRRNLTYLFITHDLGLAWIIADRIAVMYLGKIVETGNAPEIIQNPRHPYTQALISVVPSPNPSIHREKTILHGERPDPVDIPPGCRFHPRCPNAVGICGWDAEEVLAELRKLVEEDKRAFVEASTVSDLKAMGPLSVLLTTKEPARVEAYLRKRIQAVALQRPALGAIRLMKGTSAGLELALYKPVEPVLRGIVGDISVACHLVKPEEAPANAGAPPEVLAAS